MLNLNHVNSKKILIIAPNFFGYDKAICNVLTENGAEVKLYNDRPSDSFFTKSLIRISRKLLARKTNKYYDDIITNNLHIDFDHVLIVRGEAISKSRVLKIKDSFPKATLSLYLWDSMNYNPNAKSIHPLFDKVYSFDRNDAKSFKKIIFLPLFYANIFTNTEPSTSKSFEYDVCFIGTVHTDRYKILDQINTYCEENNIKFFMYCYYPSKLLGTLRGLFDSGFRAFSKRHINFKSIPLSKIVEVFDSSKCIIDVNRPEQQGLTMRSIETFGANRKLATTNKDIIEYNIFTPNNILVIDRSQPSFPQAFLNGTYDTPNKDLYNTYSLESWVSKIFGLHDV